MIQTNMFISKWYKPFFF